MQCPNCQFDVTIRKGFVLGKQRYKCKKCAYLFTVAVPGLPVVVKRNAIELYLEGLEVDEISSLLHISRGSLYNWLKTIHTEASFLRNPNGIIKVSMDELKKYLESKMRIKGYKLMLVDLENSYSLISFKKEPSVDKQSN
jgi:transposase-like protein